MGEPARFVELDGCLNFRDIGGYPTQDGRRVRWRQVFRSDALHGLSEASADHVKSELGITSVIDLRSTDELQETGRGPLEKRHVDFHHLSLFAEVERTRQMPTIPDVPHGFYMVMADIAASILVRIVQEIATNSGATVFHCAAGKDRTGIVAAVTLGLLGVSDDDIVEDYTETGRHIEDILARLSANATYQARFAELPPSALEANPTMMVGLLQYLQSEYGGILPYMRDAGLVDKTVDQLRSRLLTPPDSEERTDARKSKSQR